MIQNGCSQPIVRQCAAYNASKFGVVGFTQAVMLDLRKHGIKVTTIMPGSVSTYFNNRCLLYTSPSPRDRTRSRMPSSA